MSIKHKRVRRGWILLFIAVVGGAATFVIQGQRRLRTILPHRGPIVQAVYGLGTVTASKSFNLKVAVPTAIQAIHVKEGDMVKSGAPLVTLESMPMFRAPFAGTITSVPFKVGEAIFPQVSILTLTDLGDRYVSVSLEQQGALQVRRGQLSRLSFESIRGQKFSGVVRTIYPQEGEFFVHIDVDQLPPEILPGMTADVAIEVGRRDEALLIPVSAISSGKVMIVREGKRKKISVQVGTVDGEWAEIVSGELEPNDSVVIAGQ